MPGVLLAVMEAPVPVRQQTMPSAASPAATARATLPETSGQSTSASPFASGPKGSTSWPRRVSSSTSRSVRWVRSSLPTAIFTRTPPHTDSASHLSCDAGHAQPHCPPFPADKEGGVVVPAAAGALGRDGAEPLRRGQTAADRGAALDDKRQPRTIGKHADIGERVALHHQQVGELARRECAQLLVEVQQLGGRA